MKKIRWTLINVVVALFAVAATWFLFKEPQGPSDRFVGWALLFFSLVLMISDITLRVLLPEASAKKMWAIQFAFITFVVIAIVLLRGVIFKGTL